MELAIVGAGRMGHALARRLPDAAGPFGRGTDGHGFDAVLLTVPDHQIEAASSLIEPGRLVGHCAGAVGLDVLAPHEAFGVHPLMTVTQSGADFAGAGGAVAGSTPRALAFARGLADRLGLVTFTLDDADRAAYHAAASIASNFLTALEDAAEQLLATTGADRSILVPLARAALENWAELGGQAAITGPVARGDDSTVARQREAIADRRPDLLEMFDAMVSRTQSLVDRDSDD